MPSDQNNDRHNFQQISLLVDMNSLDNVFEEVKTLYLDMFNQGDLSSLVAVFEDVVFLFQGRCHGYKACDTPYHNLKHTTDVFLAMTRLLHGARVAGKEFSEINVRMGIIAALMHDSGYMRKETDRQPSGARLAPMHVRRSVEFMTQCLTQHGFPKKQISRTAEIILYTDHEKAASGMPSGLSKTHRMLGNMLASADLLAQTADRTYLEKLPLLYREFKEAEIGNYDSELDLIKDAVSFNDHMHARLENQLDNVKRFLSNHFQVRWYIDADLYQVAIKRSMAYLESVLNADTGNYLCHFRRSLTPKNQSFKN